MAFSPDGKRIAFVSKREGDAAAQLYVLSLDGGEAERVTERPTAVSNPKWLKDGRRIAFVSSVLGDAESAEGTRKGLEARDKAKVKARVTENRLFRFWDHWLTDDEYPHIFVVDLETRQVKDLLPGSKRHFDLLEGSGPFDVSPDGATLVFSANSTEPPFKTLNRDVFSVPTAGGPVTNLTASNPADDGDPVFSPDGKTIAYGVEKKADGWPDYTRLAVKDLATGKTTLLTDGWDNAAREWAFSKDGKDIVFHAEVRARVNLYRVPVTGGVPKELHHGGTTSGAAPLPDGGIVFSEHSLSRPPEIVVLGRSGGPVRRLTTVNDALAAQWDLGTVVEKTFKGAGDDDVQMFVLLPPGFDRGEEVSPRPSHPRRARRHVRRRLQLPLERPGLRRSRLRRGHGELPRLLELRPALRRVDPGSAPRQALHRRDARDRCPLGRGPRRRVTDGGGRRLLWRASSSTGSWATPTASRLS